MNNNNDLIWFALGTGFFFILFLLLGFVGLLLLGLGIYGVLLLVKAGIWVRNHRDSIAYCLEIVGIVLLASFGVCVLFLDVSTMLYLLLLLIVVCCVLASIYFVVK